MAISLYLNLSLKFNGLKALKWHTNNIQKKTMSFGKKKSISSFSVPSEDDVDELKKYTIKEFFPDDPMSKNFGLDTAENGGWFLPKVLEMTFVELVDDPVTKYKHSPGCIVAKSTTTGNIVGARLGTVVCRNDPVKNERIDWVANLPLWFPVPHYLTFASNVGPLFEKLRFGPPYMFEDLENANTIYRCLMLSVGREARGKGLGTELMKRSYELAKQVSLSLLTII